MAKAKDSHLTKIDGAKKPDPSTNLEAFDRLIEDLPVTPDHARILLGQTLAAALDDSDLRAATAKEYRELLDSLGETPQDENDAFTGAP